jgi:O-acetylserine/cysteine efflux transporter
VWAGNFLTSAFALREIPPFLFTAVRLSILASRSCASSNARRRAVAAIDRGRAVQRRAAFRLEFLGAAPGRRSVSPAIAMQSYVPMAALLAWWWLGERFGWRTGLAIAISFAGVLVLGLRPDRARCADVAGADVGVGAVPRHRHGADAALSRRRHDQPAGWTAIISVLPLLALRRRFEPGNWQALRERRGSAGAARCIRRCSLRCSGTAVLRARATASGRAGHAVVVARAVVRSRWASCSGAIAGPRLWIGGAMVLGGVLIIALRATQKLRPVPAPKRSDQRPRGCRAASR